MVRLLQALHLQDAWGHELPAKLYWKTDHNQITKRWPSRWNALLHTSQVFLPNHTQRQIGCFWGSRRLQNYTTCLEASSQEEAPFRNGSIVRQQQKDGIVCGNLRGKLHATVGSLFQHRTLATLSLRITGGIGLLLLTYLRNRVLRQTALQPIGDRPVFWEEETRPCKKRRLTPLHGSWPSICISLLKKSNSQGLPGSPPV